MLSASLQMMLKSSFFDIVDQDTIINDIYDILSSATPNSAIEEEEAAEFAEADEAA